MRYRVSAIRLPVSSGVTDEAICIRAWEWSETSQTAALFTLGHGVVRVLAKGSRRPKGPYSGGLELLTRADAGLIVRPNSELALLTWWDLRQTYPILRVDLSSHRAGMYIAELVFQFVRDHDAHPDLYHAVLEALDSMQEREPANRSLLRFQWRLLVSSGFVPAIDADVRTGEELPARSDYAFVPALGGLTVPSEVDRSSVQDTAWRVRSETVALLRRVAGGSWTPEIRAGEKDEVVDRANRLLASYARHILGFATPAMHALFGDRLAR